MSAEHGSVLAGGGLKGEGTCSWSHTDRFPTVLRGVWEQGEPSVWVTHLDTVSPGLGSSEAGNNRGEKEAGLPNAGEWERE